MAAERDGAVTSDTESSERRTREQLKKASISKVSGDAGPAGVNGGEASSIATTNGQHEGHVDVEDTTEDRQSARSAGEQTTQGLNSRTRHHSRKRSRDSTAEEDVLNNGQRKSGERAREVPETLADSTSNGAPLGSSNVRSRTPDQTGEKRSESAVEGMTSPKTKRSRLQSELETSEKEVDSKDDRDVAAKDFKTTIEPSQTEKEVTPIPPTSGFANSSATSPFASLARSQSPPSDAGKTSSSAFAASGFGSLSGSATSGFGALGKSSGGFGTGGTFASASSTNAEPKSSSGEQKSTFGGSLGQQSAFAAPPAKAGSSSLGSATTGFGSLGGGSVFGGGSGFGGLGGGSGLTSFASGKPSAALASSSKPSANFGAPAPETDEVEGEADADEESGIKSPLAQEEDRQDERFYTQNLATGEEEEQTDFTCRAKLYNFVTGAEGKKEWKERGLGTVRLNCKRATEDSKTSARLVMRAEGSYRVILNTPIKKEIKFGAPSGGPPEGGYLYFMGAVEGGSGLEMLQLKMRAPVAVELHEKIGRVQEEM